jgi:Pentapeptide repeats (8 copies)
LWGANLSGANLQGANFTNAILDDANLNNATNASTAIFTGAIADSGTNTHGTGITLPISPPLPPPPNCTSCNYSRRTIVNADFSGQNLAGANFSNAILINANFNGANLEGANFQGANLTGATFVGADLTRANLHNSTLVNANFDPPTPVGGLSASAASGARTRDRGYDRHVVSGTNEGDRQSHRHGSETGAQITGGLSWNRHGADGQSSTGHGSNGHSWNGHPRAGAFDRYIVPDTVTGRAGWHHHRHWQQPQQQQQPNGTAAGGTASGFTRYVVSGNADTAPQWQRPASGDAGGAHHHHWLRDGIGGANAAANPRWTRQGNTTDGATRPRWLAQDGGAEGARRPRWLAQGSTDGQQLRNASALNRFSTAMHGWWRNRQPLWAGGSRAGGYRKPGGPHQSSPPPKK